MRHAAAEGYQPLLDVIHRQAVTNVADVIGEGPLIAITYMRVLKSLHNNKTTTTTLATTTREEQEQEQEQEQAQQQQQL